MKHRMNYNEFIKKLEERNFFEQYELLITEHEFNNLYQYKKRNDRFIEIKCTDHGIIKRSIIDLLHQSVCPKCGNTKKNSNKKLSYNEFLKRIKKDDFYPSSKFSKTKTKFL